MWRLIRRVVGRYVVLVTVRGESMAPAYRDGDQVLVRRQRTVTTGQIVVAERPDLTGEWMGPPLAAGEGANAVMSRAWVIKRVAAGPGDVVGTVISGPASALAGDERVPPGHLLLLGDNPEVSRDSRTLGFFPTDRVLGTVLRRRA